MQTKTDRNEAELAEGCRHADNTSRRMLYERYGGTLMAICLRYMADREEAEDVLHDGLLHIFQSIGQFSYQGEGSLKAWLCRVMTNEALNALRKRNRQLAQEVPLEEVPDCEDEADCDALDIPTQELMRMVQELPDGYRTVFNLYVFEEKSHKEIGSLLGISEHTSSSQFYRAKCILIKKLNDYRRRNA